MTRQQVSMKNNLLLFPAAILAIGLLPLPYGYYLFLRIVVAAFSLYAAYEYSREGKKLTGWTLTFVLMALLWSPLLPIHLDRSSWFVLDLAGAALFWFAWHDSADRPHTEAD
jgi:hypothetical protein